MKKINQSTLILLIMLSVAGIFSKISAKDCGPTLQNVKVKNVTFMLQKDDLGISFVLDLDSVLPGKNQKITYTPLIVSDNNADTVALRKIVVKGRNVAIIDERNDEYVFKDIFASVRRYNDRSQSVDYKDKTPYQDWMDLCHLSLAEDICGCGDLQSQDVIDLAEFDNRPAPEPFIEFVAPLAEAVKAREVSGSAFVDYVVNKTDIRPDYRNNRREINKILATIDVVKNDTNVSITEITIHGYASPEGSYQNNVRLASGRAESLKEYVRSLYTLPESIFKSQSTPEDWAGLRKRVEASTFPEKLDILTIIDDQYLDEDSKDRMIAKKFPETYKFMLQEWYPALRHSDYTVQYIVKPFTVEETKRMMKENPDQVSLNEMFLVAQTMEPGSEEFNEVMDTAVELYPNDEIANLNAANAAIKAGDLAKASKYLNKAGKSVEVVNARGVIAMNEGKYKEARKLFNEALEMGYEKAQDNLEVLDRLEKIQSQTAQ